MKLSEAKFAEILELVKEEYTYRQIAKKLGIKESTARRYIRFVKSNIDIGKSQTLPKIIVLDIETAPNWVTVWGVFKQRIPLENIRKEWFILSWSAKLLYDNEVVSDVLTPKETRESDDKRILKSLWKVVDSADILVGHNLRQFDMRKANARFIVNGLPCPSPYQIIDTLIECKKNFAFTGYKLDYINSLLGLARKTETNYNLWLECIRGNKEALTKMEKYNRQDILVSEELYIKILPWIKSHPNVGLFSDVEEPVCPNCGSTDLHWKGYYYTTVGRYKTFRCRGCMAIGRSRKSDLSKEERKNLVAPIAR